MAEEIKGQQELLKSRKERNVTGYRESASNNGTFSTHIGVETNRRLTNYCKATNQNKTKFVEQCINEKLDSAERNAYENMSKDDLINLLMKGGTGK